MKGVAGGKGEKSLFRETTRQIFRPIKRKKNVKTLSYFPKSFSFSLYRAREYLGLVKNLHEKVQNRH